MKWRENRHQDRRELWSEQALAALTYQFRFLSPPYPGVGWRFFQVVATPLGPVTPHFVLVLASPAVRALVLLVPPPTDVVGCGDFLCQRDNKTIN